MITGYVYLVFQLFKNLLCPSSSSQDVLSTLSFREVLIEVSVCYLKRRAQKQGCLQYPQNTGCLETGSTVALKCSSARRQPVQPLPPHDWTEAPAKQPSCLSENYAPLPSAAGPLEWRTNTAGFSPLHHVLPCFLPFSYVHTPPPHLRIILFTSTCLSSCLGMKELINLI